MEEYSKFVKNLFVTKDFGWSMTHAALGISGEAGEVVDLWKKSYANGRELDQDRLRKELGDLLFYIQAMCNQMGWSLEDVAYDNILKLTKRYPEGYSHEAAKERLDEGK